MLNTLKECEPVFGNSENNCLIVCIKKVTKFVMMFSAINDLNRALNIFIQINILDY